MSRQRRPLGGRRLVIERVGHARPSWGLVGVVAAALGAVATGAQPLVGAAVALAALGLALLARPDIASVAVVAVLYSNAAVVAVRVLGAPPIVGWSLPLLLVIPLVWHLAVRSQPLVWPRATTWAAALGAVYLASGITSGRPGDTAEAIVQFGVEGLGLFVLVTNVVRTPEVLRWVLASVVGVAGAVGWLGAAQYVTGSHDNDYFGFAQTASAFIADTSDWQLWDGPSTPVGQPRSAGPIGEPNFYAAMLAVLLPYGLYLAITARTRVRGLAALAATTGAGAGVALSLSRGAVVALVLAVVVLAAIRYVPRWSLAALAAVAVASLVVVPSYQERLADLPRAVNLDPMAASDDRADAAALGRYSEVVAALAVWRDHPFLGVGPDQFPRHYQTYSAELGVHVHAGDREAHNLFAGIAAELGTLGLVAFGGLLVAVLRPLAALRRRTLEARPDVAAAATAAVASVVILMGTGLFLHLAYIRYLWLTLALAACTAAVHRHEPPPAQRAASRRREAALA